MKQINLDSSSKYSQIATANFDGKANVLTLQGNPVRNEAVLSFSSSSTRNLRLQVVDASGKPLIQQQWNIVAGYNSLHINIALLAKGIYTIQIADAQGSSNVKMMKR